VNCTGSNQNHDGSLRSVPIGRWILSWMQMTGEKAELGNHDAVKVW
jgi:hypothetical protein